MHRYLIQAAALAMAMVPVGAPAQTAPTAAAAHDDDALPFGLWTIVNRQVDESALVWSRCRGRDGSPGRWIATRPREVVHPTYVVQQEPLLKHPTSPAAKLGSLVECVSDDGSPGTPDPAVPSTSVLPAGTTIDYSTMVMVEHVGPDRGGRHYGFSLRDGESAFDDGSGPVVVTASQIALFPRSDTLSIGGPANVGLEFRRPGSPVHAAPAECKVNFYTGEEPQRRKTLAAESKPCTALTRADRDRLIRDARTQMASR